MLRACERRLPHLHDPHAKLELMREMAQIWEIELKNKASALAIWNDVRSLSPRDEEASRAVERLRASLSEEEQLLLYLRVERDMEWADVVAIVAEGDPDPRRASARLRKQFERACTKLRELAAREGIRE